MAKLSGIGTEVSAAHREVLATRNGALFLPGGRIIEGAYARDSGNTGDLPTLRAGTLMGIETTGRKYRPAVLGILQEAYTSGGLSIKVTSAQAVEIARRCGASTGVLNVVGPPTAGNTVAVITNKAYSAINTGTGVITIVDITADMIAGSFVCAYDGTTYPRAFITDPYGIKVTDENEANIDAAFEEILIAGMVKFSQLIPCPTDVSLIAWVKAQLRVSVPGLLFDSDFD